jgi:Holliday junction resolvase RusA-like endonuclease
MSNEQETQDTTENEIKVIPLASSDEKPVKQLTADGQEIKPYITLNINPVAKPRMTRSDKWKKRKATDKYWKFKKDLKILCYVASWNIQDKQDLEVTFVIPMPLSWSNVKRQKMNGQPHTSRPDLDNLIKAFKDALLDEDSQVHTYGVMKKIWGQKGQIILKR